MLALFGGVPRGGTHYAAEVATACGLYTRREAAFRNTPPWMHPTDALGESSWLTVPWFPWFTGPKVLVARPPLDVIRSQFASSMILGVYGPCKNQWLAEKFPEIEAEQGLRRYAVFWIHWMSWGLAHSDLLWPLPLDPERVEKLEKLWHTRPRVQGITDHHLDPSGVERVSDTVNTGIAKWRDAEIPWGEVTGDGELMARLGRVAERCEVPLTADRRLPVVA